MIEMVFWDFGGVFTPSPFGADMDDYAASLGVTAGDLIDLVLGYHSPDGSHPWHRVERGEVDLTDAVGEISAEITRRGISEFSIREFFGVMAPKDTGGEPGARPEVLAAVDALADAGLRQGIISNNIKEFASGWRSMLDLSRFELVIDSSEVGVRKPDPAISELALRDAGLGAPAVAFLDDFAPNLVPAAELGIHTILVESDPTSALTTIRALCAR